MGGNNSKLLQSLADIGLSEREAKVYLALLGKRRASASELQRISGIPRSKVYEVINGLVQRGYCTEHKTGRNRAFEVIDPSITLDPAFNKLEERLKNSVSFRGKLIDLYNSAGKMPEPLDFVEVLHGNDTIHHRYCQLVRDTRTELLGFGRRPYACDTSEKSAEQDRETEAVIKRGGAVRWIFELDLPEDEWILRDLKQLSRNGQQIRVADKLPLKMMIFDRSLLLVAEEEPFMQSGKLIMSLIKQGTIVNAFYALFEYFWANSLDLTVWEKRRIHTEEYVKTGKEK